jgi:hypothetical protein
VLRNGLFSIKISRLGKQPFIKRHEYTLGTITSLGGPGAVVCFSISNPICLVYTDPDGKWLANNTDSAIIVRTEDGKYELLKSGGTYYGKVDGALMKDGTIIKITDTSNLDTKIPKTDITVKTNAVDVIINQDKNGEYSFNLSGVHSKVINSLGDLSKSLSGDLKSGVYKANERPEALESWWDQATSSGPNGYGDPSTWSTQIFEKIIKELERPINE